MNRKAVLIAKLSVLLCVFLLFSSLIGRAFHQAQMRTLNYFMPGSYAELLIPAVLVDQRVFNRYITYYKIVSTLIKDNADAYALLGFCYSRIGRDQTAVQFLEKAIALKPQSFWISYDLGLLYMKDSAYNNAARALTQALNIMPQTALAAIYSSKIYVDILTACGLSPQAIATQLNKGYQQAYQLLAVNQKLAAKQVTTQALAGFIGSMNVQIF